MDAADGQPESASIGCGGRWGEKGAIAVLNDLDTSIGRNRAFQQRPDRLCEGLDM